MSESKSEKVCTIIGTFGTLISLALFGGKMPTLRLTLNLSTRALSNRLSHQPPLLFPLPVLLLPPNLQMNLQMKSGKQRTTLLAGVILGANSGEV